MQYLCLARVWHAEASHMPLRLARLRRPYQLNTGDRSSCTSICSLLPCGTVLFVKFSLLSCIWAPATQQSSQGQLFPMQTGEEDAEASMAAQSVLTSCEMLCKRKDVVRIRGASRRRQKSACLVECQAVFCQTGTIVALLRGSLPSSRVTDM